jgi:hypothetical protein
MNGFFKLLIVNVFISLFLASCNNSAETDNNTIGYIYVDIGDFDRIESVASISLDGITYAPDSLLTLYEIKDNERIFTEAQFTVNQDNRYMYWILSGESLKGNNRAYELVRSGSKPKISKSGVLITDQNVGHEFILNGKKVLRYNSETVYPPEGVDTTFKRSGFIHPLYAPNQAILTRTPDSTSDHLHHYGLWNAWKKTRFRGEEIDFFAPQFEQGTVRHANIVSVTEGPVFSNLCAYLEHVAWQDTDQEAIAIREQRDIKVFNIPENHFLIDLSFIYNPPEPLLIEEYRYAGFSFRATDYWTKNNTGIFTSEGLDRDQADGERSKWCVVTGETPEGMVSIMFMGNPLNYNHPEPMRVWPSNVNSGTGNVFINYSPTRNTDWLLTPGTTYRLKYRLLIKNGIISQEEAKNAWLEFSEPASVTWSKKR